MLFHYHFWTPYVEETEMFYVNNGFRVSLRVGKYNGDFQHFNPPLIWDDFRDEQIVFRIIEVRKGKVNITFGYGREVMFDHIGFSVSTEEHDQICENAKEMNWKVKTSDRRTFISTPFKFRIELQTHMDAIDDPTSMVKIKKLKMLTKKHGLEKGLAALFKGPVNEITSLVSDKVTIKEAVINGFMATDTTDPNGVKICNY